VRQDQRALVIARDRYTQGVIDFLHVLDVQRNLLAAQLELADSTTALAVNLVVIYKTLGGGWETDFPPTAPPPEARMPPEAPLPAGAIKS
jgi:outer membrane protein TolC